MSFPSTSSAFTNLPSSPSTSSFGSSSTPTRSHSHSVPFGSVPGSQPGVLSWGFGMSSANRGGLGWGGAQSGGGGAKMTPPPPPPPSAVEWGQTSQMNSSRRRRRSDTPDSETEMTTTTNLARTIRALAPTASGSTKRTKRTSTTSTSTSDGGLANGLAGSLSLAGNSSSSVIEDLGKSLASLDKSSLLSLLSSLLTSQPHLAPHITSLLPPPTLSSSLDLITTETRKILNQIPTGTSSEAYVTSRMRLPLESFVQEVKKLLSIYVPPTSSQSTTTTNTTTTTGSTGLEELYHPTTTMSLLLHLSASYLSISQSLPSTSSSSNPLQLHLLPILINSYHLFLTKLSTSINQQGKILSQSTVNGWFDQLNQLISTETDEKEGVQMGKKALEGVRERMRREIGWLIGINVNNAQSSGMEGVEEAEEEL
ncbi:uncharacterized protein JCM6883_002296 [Sporobolomyces salmoneus]|uniref:uncharacterized protein n=1 Tax=Sporobolomyces salmoneus TaxID=183962 RepID=UPI0031794C2C